MPIVDPERGGLVSLMWTESIEESGRSLIGPVDMMWSTSSTLIVGFPVVTPAKGQFSLSYDKKVTHWF